MSAPHQPPENPFFDVAARGYDNLEQHLPDLQHRHDDVARGLEASTRHTFEIRDRLAEIEGHGEAEKGIVKVTVDSGGRLKDLVFAQAALKLGSIGRLREAVLDASADAVDDAMRQVREASGVGPDGMPDPLGDFLGRMPEVTQMLPPELLDRLRGKASSDPDERAERKARNRIWEGPSPYE